MVRAGMAELFETMLFADDVTYSARLRQHANAIEPTHIRIIMNLDRIKEYFPKWPDGIDRLLDGFSSSRAIANAEPDNAAFIRRHRTNKRPTP